MEKEHDDEPLPSAVVRLFAAGIGSALQAVEVLTEFGAETARVVIDRGRATAGEADRRYHAAARRGDALIKSTAGRLSGPADQVLGAAAAWTDRQIVRRVAESMKPYLVEELVPEVIDGVLPKIRADVVPVVIEDLTKDERVQDLVATQSRDMLSRSVAEARRASADADDRVEALVHRLFGRRGSEG
ncbi:hypothetical protein ABIA35_006883 [Catenulispora sp. MAP12-49]|uniref:hypothetical protein n=1 Tax=Catenulispora sp. MAP12-49 TaxID=3156302 RepID=UPI003511F5D2